jgi:hypothetical protein
VNVPGLIQINSSGLGLAGIDAVFMRGACALPLPRSRPILSFEQVVVPVAVMQMAMVAVPVLVCLTDSIPGNLQIDQVVGCLVGVQMARAAGPAAEGSAAGMAVAGDFDAQAGAIWRS